MKPIFWGLPPPKKRNKKNKRHLNNTFFSFIRLRSYITDGWIKVELSKLQENISQKLDARTLNHTTTRHRISCFFLDQSPQSLATKKAKTKCLTSQFFTYFIEDSRSADLCQDKNAYTVHLLLYIDIVLSSEQFVGTVPHTYMCRYILTYSTPLKLFQFSQRRRE